MTDTVDRIGTPAQAPRSKRWIVLLVAVLVPLGSFLVFDRHASAKERDALLSCVERAQAQVRHAQGVVRGVAEYASPQLSSPLVTRQVRVSLRQLVQKAAGDGVLPVMKARAKCSAVSMWRRHGHLRDARDRYVSYLSAAAANLSAVQADFNEYGEVDQHLFRTLEQARSALTAVLSGGAQARVEALLSP